MLFLIVLLCEELLSTLSKYGSYIICNWKTKTIPKELKMNRNIQPVKLNAEKKWMWVLFSLSIW